MDFQVIRMWGTRAQMREQGSWQDGNLDCQVQVDACQKEQKKQKFTISLDMHQILKVAYML